MSDKAVVGCDLAIEAHEMLAMGKTANFLVEGVEVERKSYDGVIKITRVKVCNDDGAKALNKPMGSYVTIEMPRRFDYRREVFEKMCTVCAEELLNIMGDISESCVLTAGLGNKKITADALGPLAVEGLIITRHLKHNMPKDEESKVNGLCGIAPGVLGTTGIETEEIIKSIVGEIKPSCVIVVDALCSGDINRINTTVQITDTGITPGGGVGNRRKTINSEVLGVPVIAIGVPTVVDAATIAAAGMDILINGDENKADREDRRRAIRAEMGEEFKNLIVTPKEVDSAVEDIARVIANAVNMSVHKGISLKESEEFMRM